LDKAARTITISDNGIGMSRDEAVQHLGTIAKSGTREFFAQLTGDQQKDAQLIGQFGVGFYSSFIVADRVTVITRRAGLPAEGVKLGKRRCRRLHDRAGRARQRGTDVILHLKEGEDELLSTVEAEVDPDPYSDHIATRSGCAKEEWDKDRTSTSPRTRRRPSTRPARCGRAPRRHHRGAVQGVLQARERTTSASRWRGRTTASRARQEYIQLLYVPAKAPFDLWDRNPHGIKLYVKRVFIMDDAEQLMPPYLRFVRGVIDSADLPLNVSREILQESRDVKAIREGSTKRVLGLLEDLAENRKDDYASFWTEFGQVLKEGIGEDHANKERIAKLLRFASTTSEAQQTCRWPTTSAG
jgi:molecular chaperone HtpG